MITNIVVILPLLDLQTQTQHLSCHHSGSLSFCCVVLLSICQYSISLPATSDNNLAPSQRPQVVARAGLLPHELARLSLSGVPRHQAGQEAFGTGGDALTLAPADHVLSAGPRRPGRLAPGESHSTLQQLRGAVVQRRRDLQIQAVIEGGTGHGLWDGERSKGDKTK